MGSCKETVLQISEDYRLRWGLNVDIADWIHERRGIVQGAVH